MPENVFKCFQIKFFCFSSPILNKSLFDSHWVKFYLPVRATAYSSEYFVQLFAIKLGQVCFSFFDAQQPHSIAEIPFLNSLLSLLIFNHWYARVFWENSSLSCLFTVTWLFDSFFPFSSYKSFVSAQIKVVILPATGLISIAEICFTMKVACVCVWVRRVDGCKSFY